MPTISIFYGIIIRIFYDEHGPPHFHVAYQGYDAVIDIRRLEIREGQLPRRALNLVLDWAELHQTELLVNWELIEKGRPLSTIKPLE